MYIFQLYTQDCSDRLMKTYKTVKFCYDTFIERSFFFWSCQVLWEVYINIS